MNIAFWSNVNGKCATSGNMLAIGTMASVIYSIKPVFLQYDYESKPIEEVFEGRGNNNIIRDEISYYQSEGLDDLLSKIKLRTINEEYIYNSVKSINDTNISYVPSSKKIRHGIDEETAEYLSGKLIQTLENVGDINFIDNQNGNKRLSRKIINKSDVVVVNLCQGMSDIGDIISDENIMKKVVFLVGKYDDDSKENIDVIRKKYNINKDSIAVIPYNIHFHDAINEGSIIEFISKSIYSRRNDVNFEFINQLYKATNMILGKAGFSEAV